LALPILVQVFPGFERASKSLIVSFSVGTDVKNREGFDFHAEDDIATASQPRKEAKRCLHHRTPVENAQVELAMNKNPFPRRSARALGLLLLGVITSGTLLAQPGPDVIHAGVDCIPETQFAILVALIRPSEEIQSARVYFRSDKYPDFYYVDMTQASEEFQAILPKPSPETEQVIYYIEAVDLGFSSNRTAEHVSEVVEDEDECRRRDPAAAYYTGSDPGIVVGALRAGAPPVPAGFLADGISRFIPVAGATGGGVGAPTAIAIGAGAAGAAGVGVVVASGGDTSTTTTSVAVSPPPPPPTTTSVTTSVPVAPAVQACYSTSPDPAVIEVGERIKLDARCSEPKGSLTFTWELGDGRTRQGPFIEPSYSIAGTYTVVLTVRRTSSYGGLAQTTADEDTARFQVIVNEPEEPEPQGADLLVTKTGSPEFFYPWETILTYTITVENLGPETAEGVIVVDTLPPELEVIESASNCLGTLDQMTCQVGTLAPRQSVEITFQMDAYEEPDFGDFIENKVEVSSPTADPNPANDTATARNPVVLGQRTLSIELTATSLLEFTQTDDRSTGNVVLNAGAVDTTTSGVSFQHRFLGRPGKNTLEAYPTEAGREGLWRFDFTGARAFVAGSFQIESGQVISRDPYAIVFRLSGTAGEGVRFSFDLAPRRW
jgi:uncharacterized repeat protein (TIGR01451 family)